MNTRPFMTVGAVPVVLCTAERCGLIVSTSSYRSGSLHEATLFTSGYVFGRVRAKQIDNILGNASQFSAPAPSFDQLSVYGDTAVLRVAEREGLFATTVFAYSGRYSLRGDKVIHHVEISSVESWVHTDLDRLIKLEGDRLTLRTPPISVGGVIQTTELIWERVKN